MTLALTTGQSTPAALDPPVHSVRIEGQEFVPLERLLRIAGIQPGDAWTSESAVEVIRRLLAWRYLASASPPVTTSRPDGSVGFGGQDLGPIFEDAGRHAAHCRQSDG